MGHVTYGLIPLAGNLLGFGLIYLLARLVNGKEKS